MGKFIDLTGKKFGRLIVIKRNDYNNNQNKPLWVCKCDCGNEQEIVVTGSSLKNGATKSCGCLKEETVKLIGKQNIDDLTGKVFGKLTVIARKGSNKYRHSVWKCKCECGNYIDVISNSLKNGDTISCGCYRKEIVSANSKNKKILNEYEVYEDIIIGFANNTNNKFYIDKEDYEKIKNYTWHENDSKYIYTTEYGKYIALHRLVMNVNNEDITVDHIYHNTYDNRKSQLRIATTQQQTMNQGVQSNNTSGTTGVSWKEKSNKWQSSICVNGKTIYLGVFSDIKEAIKIRKEAELKYFGEFAYKEKT